MRTIPVKIGQYLDQFIYLTNGAATERAPW